MLEDTLHDMAAGAANKLQEKLSQEGSGMHHEGNPNRSSAPGEYPAEQTRALRDSVNILQMGPFEVAFGVFDAPDYALKLEYEPPSRGGRPFMSMALVDPEIHQAALDSAR